MCHVILQMKIMRQNKYILLIVILIIKFDLKSQQLTCSGCFRPDSTIALDTSVFTNKINSTVKVSFHNKKYAIKNKIYLSSEHILYVLNKSKKTKKSITLKLGVKQPIHTTLFINNNAENAFQFYLDEGNYELNIDCKNKTAKVTGSPLNDDYKEMMRIHDSMYKKYNIMHAMLYPYNGMDRDSAQAWLQKYLPLCNELSGKHINQFYDTHLSSFLTLEYIYNTLGYTFEDPGYDTIAYDIKKLKILFDKIDPKLSNYKMYDEWVAMFKKERIIPPKITKPLFNYDSKN